LFICEVTVTPFRIVPMSPGDRSVSSVSRCSRYRMG